MTWYFHPVQDINTLEVYLLARKFRKEVITLTHRFPIEEKYLLTTQIKDSARSITANIAEGYGRYYYQDSIRFYRVSRGSLMETYDHLSSALDENYITDVIFEDMKKKQEYLLEKLNGYIAYVKRRKKDDENL